MTTRSPHAAGANANRKAQANAHEALAAQGFDIPATTLDHWRHHSHAARYERIRQETWPQIRERLAEDLTALAEAHMQVEWELLTRVQESIPELPARDVPGALRNLAVSSGIAIDHAAPLRGEPTSRVEVVESYNEAMRVLKRSGLLVDSGAEEIEGEGPEDEG